MMNYLLESVSHGSTLLLLTSPLPCLPASQHQALLFTQRPHHLADVGALDQLERHQLPLI